MWSLERIRVMDGLRMGPLPMVPLSWSRQVRDGGMDATHEGESQAAVSGITLPYAGLAECGVVDLSTPGWREELEQNLMPFMYGAALFWDGVPIVIGPFTGTPQFTDDGVSVTVGGVTDILAKRFVVSENFSATSTLSWSGLSLGTIAKRVVQAALAKPNGGLPITFGDDETAPKDAYHTRTFYGYNVANLSAADILSKIANVGSDSVEGVYGPDIDFRPEIVDSQHVGWHMTFGTENDPYIGQDSIHDWEEGSDGTGNLTRKFSADYVAHRVYGVGDGQDEGTRVTRVSTDIPEHMPLLESVISDSQWSNDNLLKAHANASLQAAPLRQFTLDVRADGATPLGTFWPGDVCKVTTHDTAGFSRTWDLRIQSMSGDESPMVSLTFDPTKIV